MKLLRGIFWTLVLITVIIQFGSSKIVSKREESNYENGTDVVVIKPELLDIVLTGPNLTFEFCEQHCNTELLVCFEPVSANQSGLLDLCDSKCGYYVDVNEKELSFMRKIVPKKYNYHTKRDKCHVVSMKYNYTVVSPYRDALLSCDPKIENGIVHLQFLNASSECPMTIKNAKLTPNEVSAPNPSSNGNSPSNNNPENTPSPDSSATTSKIIGNYFGWFFVLFASFYLLHE